MTELEIQSEVEDDSWVFDSLVNFLHGSIWKLPVFGFVEEKSVVFDPDSYNNMSAEKEEEYRKIHDEYKALVDFMLASFMEDLEVSPEQVEEACRSRETTSMQPESNVTKLALEQLWAAEDFNSFRRLMTRKNIDLQLQSLELLVSKYGVLSPSLRNSNEERLSEDDGDQDFLEVVIRYTDGDSFGIPALESTQNQASPNLHSLVSSRNRSLLSKGTYNAQPQNQSPSHPQFLPSLPSPSSAPITTTTRTSQLLEQEKAITDEYKPVPLTVPSGKALVKATIETTGQDESIQGEVNEENDKTVADITSAAPEQFKILTSVRRALAAGTVEHAPVAASIPSTAAPPTGGIPVSEEDIQRRRDYMRSQRDKLVALKRDEREKQMMREEAAETATGGPSSRRPKSAKAAAQMALTSTPKGIANERSLAARRALAERLKHELLRE